MSTGVAERVRNRWDAARPALPADFPFLVAVLVGVLIVFPYATDFFLDTRRTLVIGAVALLSVAGALIPYPKDSPAFTIVLRTILVVCAVLHLANWHDPSLALDVARLPMDVGRYVAAASCIAGLWRPALGVVGMGWVAWRIDAINDGTGWGVTHLHSNAVIQTGLLLVVGLIAVTVARWLQARRKPDAEVAPGSETRLSGADIVLLVAFVFFLRTYFASGVSKLALDGNPLSWLLDSQLEFSIPDSAEQDRLPIPGFRHLFGAWHVLRVPVNLLALVVEVGTLVALAKRSWLRLICLGVIGFHLAIFLSSGIFFWEFIALLAGAFFALRRLPMTSTPLPLLALLVVVLVFPHIDSGPVRTLNAASLDWYAAPAANQSFFVAEFEDGRRIRVPSNYFLSVSFGITHPRFARVGGAYFPGVSENNTVSHDLLEDLERCRAKTAAPDPGHPKELALLRKVVRAHHRDVLSLVDGDGHLAYDWYPHLVWSSPFEADEFADADLRTITRYVLVNRAVCFEKDGNDWTTKVVARYRAAIEIKQ